MTDAINVVGLRVERTLHAVIVNEILPGTGLDEERFFTVLRDLSERFGPRNRTLLAVRDQFQARLDDWHRSHPGQPDPARYEAFLREIGYLVPAGEDFQISTGGVDPEIALVAGPQLVAPVTNARYALNAANARWGSLYDALYGTDVLPEEPGLERGPDYNPARGAAVVARAAAFLDQAVPLEQGGHGRVAAYFLEDRDQGKALAARLNDGRRVRLADPGRFAGYTADENQELRSILLVNNGLHLELVLDRTHPVGREHPAGLKDVVLEAAVTTILDMEDSVAAVDGPDKALCYRNLLGLMRGDLSATFSKNSRQVVRELRPDRVYVTPRGGRLVLPGRSLLMVRTVGLLMTTGAVRDVQGRPVFEGILDTLAAAAAALHDLRGQGPMRNSRSGAVYLVKPKLHGPEEVGFVCDLFDAVEDGLGLARNTLKIGVMDEERRTTVNLKECIRAARERIIFINTGFLDRTGDEIHTCMEAGPVVRKSAMKSEKWIAAYEDWNVDTGLACGFSGRAQIGKGMWPKPDMMREMVETKIGHPQAGANCAWVPSPTAATLHAMHYHEVDVFARQRALQGQRRAGLADLLTLPLLSRRPTDEEISEELSTNAQSILGYVVRWVEQGVGCSKVPDLADVGLMEDRATLRISSQHIANWLHHGICTRDQVIEHFQRMARTVDRQNAGDPNYRPMGPDFDSSIAFAAALELVFEGRRQPNGYTEPILHARREEFKRRTHPG